MTWTVGEEIVVIDKDEYHFALDEFRRARAEGAGEDQMVFIHLTVRKWTPSVYKEILRNWKLFRECVTCPLYAVAGADPTKWEAFVSRLGFKFLNNVICESGAERRLFIHTKENKSDERHFTGNKQQYDQPVG